MPQTLLEGTWEEVSRQGARLAGKRVRVTVLDDVDELARRPSREAAHLSGNEAELLRQINQGLPAETWQRYHALMARLRAETLTPDEHAELLRLTDTVEMDNANRIRHLIALAKLRGTSLEDVMQALGIRPQTHA